jgi:uracil-DNA glycosylase
VEGLQARLRPGRAGGRARRASPSSQPTVRDGRGALTRRRSSYRSIASLQRDNRVCRACAEEGFPLFSLPVVQPYTGQRAYIHGQAPGVEEGRQRLPWRGRAGKTLRRWLELDEDEFYATFYCASVTRCYPGRSTPGSGDRTPTPREQELCSLWREWELRLIRPELILAVGGLSARRLLGIKNLGESIGRRYELGGATAIPLPHPSGTSRWLNDAAHRERLTEALGVVKQELLRLRTAPLPSSP